MGGIGNSLPASLDSQNIGFTKEGGLWCRYINKTGADSVVGTMVNTEGSLDSSVAIVGADEADIIGVIYEDGVPDGGLVKVVVTGSAYVLLEDSTASTRGYWCRSSITQAGRVDATNAAPPGGTIAEIDAHFHEVGHCLETKTAGTDVLCLVHIHFN